MRRPDESAPAPESTAPLPGMDKAVEALQSLFQGIAQAAQSAFGSEFLRNFQAASWLAQVADCLDRLTISLRAGHAMPTAARGELTFFREQLTSELHESKFAPAAFLTRLDLVLQSSDPAVIEEAAGYFRAASASVSRPQEQSPT